MVGGTSVACSGGGPADTKERVARFEAKLSKELGTEVHLECPMMIDQHYHYCTAVVPEVDDLAFPVRVLSRGDELEYTTKRWVTGANMVQLGKHALKEKLDVDVEDLSCPKVSYMPDGATVRCEAKAKGVTMGIDVSMVMKVRKLHFEPVSGVVLGVDASKAGHKFLGSENVYAEVSCARAVIVSVPGKRFTCEATMPDAGKRTIHYVVTSTDGTFALGDVPPPAEGVTAEAPAAPAPASSAGAGR